MLLLLSSSHQTVLSTQRHHQQYTQCPSWFFILERYDLCGHRLSNRETPKQNNGETPSSTRINSRNISVAKNREGASLIINFAEEGTMITIWSYLVYTNQTKVKDVGAYGLAGMTFNHTRYQVAHNRLALKLYWPKARSVRKMKDCLLSLCSYGYGLYGMQRSGTLRSYQRIMAVDGATIRSLRLYKYRFE